VQSIGAETLAVRAARVREMESTSAVRVSLEDELHPEVVHSERSNPAFDRSRSGITNTGSVSVALNPAFAVPPGAAPPPLPAGFQQFEPMPPVAVAPQQTMSRSRFVLLVVIASALLGCVLIAFALLIRSHMRPSTPAVAAGQTSGRTTPAPKQSAAPAPSAAPTPEQVADRPAGGGRG
jgi:hypothetical protein